MRRLVLRATDALDRMQLAEPAFHLYERLKARGGGNLSSVDGPPLPPAHLRFQVDGGISARRFLDSGRVEAETLRREIQATGRQVAGPILDFGAGCGRVARYWDEPGVAFYATDYNRQLVGWMAKNLPFVHADTNELQPPLRYPDGFFAVVYAISVLTHLPEQLQRDWMREFHRILQGDGLLLLTTHGDAMLPRMVPEERERYQAGEMVIRHANSAGSNLCTTYHPREWFEAELLSGFRLERFVPSGISAQDLYVLQRI